MADTRLSEQEPPGAKTNSRGERTVDSSGVEGKKGLQGKETVGVLPLPIYELSGRSG